MIPTQSVPALSATALGIMEAERDAATATDRAVSNAKALDALAAMLRKRTHVRVRIRCEAPRPTRLMADLKEVPLRDACHPNVGATRTARDVVSALARRGIDIERTEAVGVYGARPALTVHVLMPHLSRQATACATSRSAEKAITAAALRERRLTRLQTAGVLPSESLWEEVVKAKAKAEAAGRKAVDAHEAARNEIEWSQECAMRQLAAEKRAATVKIRSRSSAT